MPEGDSVAGHALLLRPILEGETIVAVGGSSGSVRTNAGRLAGASVDRVWTHGKNLVVDFDSGYSLRVHLGMNGRWRISSAHGREPGAAKVVLTTRTRHAACLGAPTVDVDRTPSVVADLGRLGPDLLGDFDEEEFLRRARRAGSGTIAELLLDQRVAAGIGNVYKSEILFLHGIHPHELPENVTDEELRSMASKATALMKANIGPGDRSTTGSRARGRRTWVYNRESRACHRCGVAIAGDRLGDRVTYWCPGCQSLRRPSE